MLLYEVRGMKNNKTIFLAGRVASAAISTLLSSVLIDPFQYAQKGIEKRDKAWKVERDNERKHRL